MPIQTLQYKIRHLKRQEIEQLLQLCKAEGRHMGTVAEIESWMQIDPNGFFVAVNEKGMLVPIIFPKIIISGKIIIVIRITFHQHTKQMSNRN